MILELLKQTLRPSSITCILALVTPGVVLLNIESTSRWGRRWLTAVVGMYWILSCPITVNLLARTLTADYQPITAAAQAQGAQAIVLLGAGSINLRARGEELPLVGLSSGLRALEAARLFKLLDDPLVIASGGVTERRENAVPESAALVRALVDLSVRPERIVAESESKNTRDEAIIIKEMLRERGITRFLLVTSPLHMPRSMRVFEAQGLRPIPAVSALVASQAGTLRLLPNDISLSVGDGVLYEWSARTYYWWRGWL